MIKLKSLINEQLAPPAAAAGAPVPLQTPPPAPPSPEEEQPTALEPESDLTPSPEDPGEYDWTKDFRAFEDAKNKAEAQAKKKLLDKMNKQLVGKKATVNASRGYGQPKTDHTIDSIKKISVEFWYKEWVVIITDENDKKYFLTPGVNIKIEQGAGIEAGADDQAPTEPDAAQTGAPGEEQPNAEPPQTVTGSPDAMAMPGGVDTTGTALGQQPGTEMTAGAPPAQPTAQVSQPGMTGTTPPPEVPLKKKKKPLAEKTIAIQSIGKDLRLFLLEFMSDSVKDKRGEVDFTPYIKGVTHVISEGQRATVSRSKIEIPVSHVKEPFDARDVSLAVKEQLFSSGNIDQRFSRGSVDISKVGRVYMMNFIKQTGWKS